MVGKGDPNSIVEVVRERGLHPFQVEEAGGGGELVQHAGGEEVGAGLCRLTAAVGPIFIRRHSSVGETSRDRNARRSPAQLVLVWVLETLGQSHIRGQACRLFGSA